MDNSKGIEQAERGINGLGKAVNVVSRKVKANRKTSSDNVESIKDINKEMTYVKTQVVEFCGYQSSWGKEVKKTLPKAQPTLGLSLHHKFLHKS